jgi:hypothetical protein
MEGLIAQYRTDEVSSYYVKQCFESNLPEYEQFETVEDAMLSWASSADCQPIAILGGYGMGKTTLAKRLAYLLADRHKTNPIARIPVMIRLDELGTEQSLEGLLGKHFTSLAVVQNYNFHIFMELAKRGRFVIFLDGFDEMKHTMSWESMRFNFQQLNRLTAGSSKLVLSGRPSAFLSHDEYQEALHGKRQVLGNWKSVPGWPDYCEIHLKQFSEIQIQEFITGYLSTQGKAPEHLPAHNGAARTLFHLKPEQSQQLFTLASRPVQLKMLLEVLPSWQRGFDALTVTILYSEFIDLIIRREMEKQSRQKYPLHVRRAFAEELAWHMWINQTAAISASKIPDSLFSLFDRDRDLAQVRRDLLVACAIDVKPPDGYYFPHRSFQEFLVAGKLVTVLEHAPRQIDEWIAKAPIDVVITPEIQEFIAGLAGKYEAETMMHRLSRFRGTMPEWLGDVVISMFKSPKELLTIRDAGINPWTYALLSIGIWKKKWTIDDPIVYEFLITTLRTIPSGCTPKGDWAKLFAVLNMMLSSELQNCHVGENERLMALLELGGTLSGFRGRRKVPASNVIAAHSVRHFCFVSSWSAEGFQLQNKWYNFGRLANESPKLKYKRERKRFPHKIEGVTKKKQYEP